MMRTETHNLDGSGAREVEVYDVPSLSSNDFWVSVTDIQCPACGHGMVRWDEAGYSAGHRSCDGCDRRFMAKGNATSPKLVMFPHKREKW